jgi:uracil-DNA glycosylase
MTALNAQIKACRSCDGMNIRGVTQAAPGYGSLRSPVVIVGQSLCEPCMKTQIPFTGGSGRFLDDSLARAGDLSSGRTYTTLTYGQSYHHGHWTIYPDQSGTRFVNEGTDHGMFVSIDNVYSF